jgi:hypothetical protein
MRAQVQVLNMIIRAIVLSLIGLNGLLPAEPLPAFALQARAKYKSVSNMCLKKKKKSKQARELCARWEQHNA